MINNPLEQMLLRPLESAVDRMSGVSFKERPFGQGWEAKWLATCHLAGGMAPGCSPGGHCALRGWHGGLPRFPASSLGG